jgi:putative SOS response-associated peptidase YedK
LFAFAGLWERWKDPSGQWIRSCSILTTMPNALTSTIHDRMPVLLEKSDYDLWLDPGMTKGENVTALLKPYDARLMRLYPVSNRVNQVQNDDADCAAPITLKSPPQGQLFY